jgi:hypothetical protein
VARAARADLKVARAAVGAGEVGRAIISKQRVSR